MNRSNNGYGARFLSKPARSFTNRWSRNEAHPIVLSRDIGKKDVCFICYARGHWARHCDMDISSNYLTVVANYGKLAPEDKSSVPKDSFVRAVKLLQANVENFSVQAELVAKETNDA